MTLGRGTLPHTEITVSITWTRLPLIVSQCQFFPSFLAAASSRVQQLGVVAETAEHFVP